MGALIRMPLRMLLPCLAVSFVAFGAVAAGLAGVAGASGYLMRQADNNLLACASSMLSHGFVALPDSSQVPPVPCGMELLSASGQVLTLAAPGPAYGPAVPAGGAWLAALALTRAISRPLRTAAELAETAGQAAGGKPSNGMPRRGLWAGTDGSRWPLGMTLTKMPEQLSASRAAEAAARRSADEMSRHLGETALELLRSVNVVRGFAEYYRQQPKPSAARLDRMLRRVADEAAQMGTLIDGLDAPLLGSAGPGSRETGHPEKYSWTL